MNVKDRKEQLFSELKDLDFVQELLKEYDSYDSTRYYLDEFTAENLEIIFEDELGQCAVFLNLEDYCAIRDITGKWRRANGADCYKMKEGTLKGMYSLDSINRH